MASKGDINPATGKQYAINPASGVWDDTYWSEVVEPSLKGGGGRSAESIDMSQVPSVQSYVQGQFAAEDPALNDLVMAMRSREKPLDIYGRLETEAGLPELRKASSTLSKEIFSLEDYLDRIEPDVTARTRESLVTEAQRRGMVQAGKEPVLEKLEKFGLSLGRLQGGIEGAERSVGNKVGLAMTGQEQELEPLKLRFQVMVDRNARMLTGFTADRQTQLDVMFDKLNRERQLSDQEWALANELASEERNYMKTLQTSAANAGITLKGSESATDILGLVGKTAAETIAWERAYKTKTAGGTGTATERAQAVAITSLRRDSASGRYSYPDLVRMYGDTVPSYQIRENYGAVSPYGPAKETEEEVVKWTLKPKVPTSGSSGYGDL